MTQWTKIDIELAFIREFQTADNHLARPGSSSDKHERVRVAIMRESRAGLIFHDSNLTYAQAFKVWSGKSAEMRASPRAAPRLSHIEDDIDTDDWDAGDVP